MWEGDRDFGIQVHAGLSGAVSCQGTSQSQNGSKWKLVITLELRKLQETLWSCSRWWHRCEDQEMTKEVC